MLRNGRLVVPASLQLKMIGSAHEGRLGIGIVKTKQSLWFKLWKTGKQNHVKHAKLRTN